MSGGANSIKDLRAGIPGSQVQEIQRNLSQTPSTFQKLISQRALKVPGDPKAYLAGLGRVTQTGELSFTQRFEAFRMITEQIIIHPSNPYSRIEKELREEMIETVAGTLADSPLALPRAVRKVV